MRCRLGLKRNDRGATAIEYGLIAGLIGLGLVAALTSTRGSLNKDLGCIATGVAGGTPTCGAPPTPTTILGYAEQMAPAGRTVTGGTMAPGNSYYSWFGYSSPNATTVLLNVTADYRNNYTFTATPVASGVFQVVSYGGAPIAAQPGNITYAMMTPLGWALIDTKPTP